MSNQYGLFWNSENHDRVYDADDFAEWLRKFFNTGVFSGELEVSSNGGMDIVVDSGYCNIDGKVKFFDNATTFTLSAASGIYSRIDTIVVEKNDSERAISLKYVQGEFSSSPIPKPPVREGGVYQLVLAQIMVGVGATSITDANITDTRGQSDLCGYVTTVAVAGNDSVINITREGLVFTAERSDGETFTFDQQDTVTKVKGNAETSYRGGNVNLTPANIGAVNKTGDSMTGDLTIAGTKAIKTTDKDNYVYPLIFDNATNLWIGSSATQATHHTGATYISSGYNNSSNKGYASIYVSVPNESNTNATNYEVYHKGNLQTATTSRDGIMTKEMVTQLNSVDADNFVKKSGDTMTGNLTLSSSSNLQERFKNTTANLKNSVNNVTSNTYSSVQFRDTNDYLAGEFRFGYLTSGLIRADLRVQNRDTSGTAQTEAIFGISQAKDGTITYNVSGASALTSKLTEASTSAKGLLSSSDKTKLNNIQANANNIKMAWGATTTGSLSGNNSHTITLTGGKPSGTIVACIPIAVSPATNWNTLMFIAGTTGTEIDGKFSVQTVGSTNQKYTVTALWIYY